jgi:ferredoxin
LRGKFREEDLQERNMLKVIALVFVLLAPVRWIYIVDEAKCNGCGHCLSSCPQGAISMAGGDAYIDPELCDGCGTCVNYCPRGAIYRDWYTGIEEGESDALTLSFSQNPVSGSSVTVMGIVPLSEVQMLDGTGRQVLQAVSDEQGHLSVNLSGLPDGSYLIVTENHTAVLTAI